MRNLFTIGYEGSSVQDFVASLKVKGVEVLIDVRDVPQSRKRGFSKRALAETLEEVGIQYLHLRELGDPKPGRDAARRGDFNEFRRIFKNHLNRSEAQAALDLAIGVAADSSACLLCYEREPAACHRKMVAEAMAACRQFKISHLGVREGLASQGGDRDGSLDRGLKVA